MRQRALALLFLLFLPLGGSAAAEEPAPRRPKIGLALGGGGARGAAHVGVLRVLERLNIPVDYVAGTSMGAIIGGLYASGLSVDQIEEELRSTNWSDLLADRPTYRDLVWRRKQDEGTYLLDLELGLRGAKLIVPTGLRAGQKLGFKLQTLLLPVGEVQDFSRLPIPFAAVATDVETGDRVILDHGDLAQSILASMTIPGVFSPAEIDGRLLVDGGMADNLPVEVVKAMGADIVIAVSVGTPLAGRDTLGSFLGVTGQAFGFLTVKNAERSAKLADVVIRPDLEGIDSGNFGLIGEAIPRGEAAAEGMRDKLQVYAIPAAEIVRPAPPPAPSGKLTGIEVAGNERVDARIIVARAGLQPGEELSIPRLRLALRRVFGLSEFQWARFELDPKDEGPAVLLRVKEKPWGPTYLHFGLEFVDDLEGEAEYALKLNLTRTMLNSRGAEWRNDLQVGSQPSLRSELYQPLDFKGRLFVAPWASVSHGRQPIFIDGRKTAYYAVDVDEVALDVGSEYGRFGEVRVGAYRSWIEADVETGAADLPSFDIDGGGVTVAATFETLDRPSIPRRGVSVGARCNFSRESLGATDSYDKLEFGVSYFFGRGRHTGFGVADYGSNLGSQLPIYDQFAVGGLFSLGGYSEGELSGQAVAGASLGYHYRLQTLPSGLGEGVYLGALLEARNAWESTKEISASDLRYGFTLLLGADTFLGPIFVGYGVAEAGRDRLYLTIGRSL